jgi:hypothetical protein
MAGMAAPDPSAELRARAIRMLRMADEFPNDAMGRHLRELAAELETSADALERKD